MRTVLVLTLLTSHAIAGARDHYEPPALSDEKRNQPTPEAALAAAHKLFAVLPGKRPEVIIRSMAVPYVQYLKGRSARSSESHCFKSQRYTDEGEGLPGAPQCLAAGLAKIAAELEASLSADEIFPSLAELEARHGALPSPARALVKPLKHHLLVFATAGAARVALAVRKDSGRVTVDAVLADLP